MNMGIRFSTMQNFSTMNNVQQSIKQSIMTQRIEAGSIVKLPNGSLPPEGHVNPFEDPDLNLTGKDPSEWRKIISVDSTVAEKLKNLTKEDFVKRNGMCGNGSQADAQADIIKAYVATLPGDQKLAAIHSCQQIASGEAERIVSIIRKQNPSWQYGQSIDTSILEQPPTETLNIRA